MNFRKSILLVVISLAILSGYAAAVCVNQREIAAEVVRLHIRAASDSAEDQRLKEAVRDRLLKDFFSEELPSDRAQAVTVLFEGLERIEYLARDELALQGCDAEVRAYLTAEYFDTGYYDGFTLPAGKYTALRVDIGPAEGKNWFCVMYPPVCMPASGLSPAKAFGRFKMVTKEPSKLKIGFKVLEWVGDLKRLLGL